MSIKITRNFDLNKLARSKFLSLWLNEYGRKINQRLQLGLNTGMDIFDKSFKSGKEFTRKSIQDGDPHKSPLVRSGRLAKSIRLLPATEQKLSFTLKTNVKTKKRWNVVVDGTKSRGTRTSKLVNYGALHNNGDVTTSENSLIPNKTVRQRAWFGIPKSFLVGGEEWKKLSKKLTHYIDIYKKTAMKELK